MTETEREILQTLVTMDEAVAAMPANPTKPDLMPLFQRLDNLARALPRGTDPQLLHYLHRKSYQKARLLLEGRDNENQAGNCH